MPNKIASTVNSVDSTERILDFLFFYFFIFLHWPLLGMKEYIQVKEKGIKVSLNKLIYSSYVCIVCKQALYFECSGEQEALSCGPRV